MPLRLRVADLDGKATGGRVTLVLKKPVWNEKERRQRYVEVTRSNVDVPPSGLAKATLPAQAEGELLVEASMPDGSGRTAVATWSFWVAGPQTQWQREETQPALTLKPDKRWYQPGTVAKVLVTSNVTNRPILTVAEGLDIWAYTVIPAGKRNFVWHLPAQLEMSPTAYVGAAAVDAQRPHLHQCHTAYPRPFAQATSLDHERPPRVSPRAKRALYGAHDR
jgi:hypothetical protein